ncbi:murein biosynthesis integral membrane protein MurJ [Quadrisphaera sp. GCM10027208]|uniref:murein biosynthesis integral membrane protein MurJ n=1 Tax=Quadrisphaera sp. GCM10027208 TaxID=3273423 RepID=UPI003609ACD6
MSLLRSTAVMAAGTATSRVLGFVRAAVLAWAIGVNAPAADAFALANTIPNNLYMLIAGGVLNAVLVPQIVRAARRGDGGQEYTDRLLSVALAVLLTLAVGLTVGAPLVVTLYANDFDGDLLALTVAFALWCLPQVFFYGLYTLLGQVLNARGSFGPYMWAPALNNVVAIGGLLVFVALFGSGAAAHPVEDWTPERIAVLAGTATLGVVSQALVLVVPLRRTGFRFRPRGGWRGMGLGTAGRVASWTFAGVLVGQLGYLLVTNIAAAAREATKDLPPQLAAQTPGYAAWGLAYLLFMLPHSLIAVSLVTALFTRMSGAAADGDVAAVRRDVSGGLRVLGVASVLATVGLLVLAGPAGRLISAQATDAEAQAIARVAAGMALGLVAFSASYLLNRAFYAFEDARTPFVVQAVVVAVWSVGNVLAWALLPPRAMVVGVAVAMSVAHVVGAVLSAVLLRRRLGGLDTARVVRTHVRLLAAGTVAGLVGVGVSAVLSDLTWSSRTGALGTALLAGSAITLTYLLALRVLHVDELDDVLRRVPGLRRFARPGRRGEVR